MRLRSALFISLGLLVAAGCTRESSEGVSEQPAPVAENEPAEALSVFTVNYPLEYFAQRIGGDLVKVSFPAPADADPAFWAPDPETVAEYQQADLILLNGVGYAKWLERATLPMAKLVDTSAGLEDRRIPLVEGPVHTHGPEGEHSHKGFAFTTWLDPLFAIEQARSIARTFSQALPGHEGEIEAGLEKLVADLQDLDATLEMEAQRIGDQPLLFSHPVYQYLEARYRLNGKAVHFEPDESPSTEQWSELEGILRDHPAVWMIWEAEPLTGTAERLAELGVASLVYSPAANCPNEGDLLMVMGRNAASLQAIRAPK